MDMQPILNHIDEYYKHLQEQLHQEYPSKNQLPQPMNIPRITILTDELPQQTEGNKSKRFLTIMPI